MHPISHLILLTTLILLAALLYSSVGHGGGSGYLAAMVFFGVAPAVMKPTALVLNLVVAGIGSIRYARAGCFSWSVFWPFAIFSIPCAFLGGSHQLQDRTYRLLLGLVLLVAAWRLAFQKRRESVLAQKTEDRGQRTSSFAKAAEYKEDGANIKHEAPDEASHPSPAIHNSSPSIHQSTNPPSSLEDPSRLAPRPAHLALHTAWALLLGAPIGLLSGLVGVGGGIFLSPLLLLLGWADIRRTAGVSVVFILVNSASGLLGQILLGPGIHSLPHEICWWIPAALLGGLVGSELGSHRLAPLTMRRLLAAVLAVAGAKLLVP